MGGMWSASFIIDFESLNLIINGVCKSKALKNNTQSPHLHSLYTIIHSNKIRLGVNNSTSKKNNMQPIYMNILRQSLA